MIALNNLFILEPYKQGQGIRGEMKGGLLIPGQRFNLVGLKLMADTQVEGNLFKKGSVAYIPEDFLTTHDSAKKVRKIYGQELEFIQVESRYVSMVEKNEG